MSRNDESVGYLNINMQVNELTAAVGLPGGEAAASEDLPVLPEHG